jgi:hypothetical protein
MEHSKEEVMFAPDDITQITGALETLPNTLDYRSTLTGKRQHLLREKQTDALPSFTPEIPHARVARRQVIQLREENRHLQAALDGQRAEWQKVVDENTHLRAELDREMVALNQSHQQELAYYQAQLQGLMQERDQLSVAQREWKERYQQMQQSFHALVEQEAHKLVQHTVAQALEAPDEVSPLMVDAVKTIEYRVRQEEDRHMRDTLYLKREVQRMAEILEQERRQVQQEHERLLSFQLSLREQAAVRQKLFEQRLSTHGKLINVLSSFSLLIVFVILEFVCLALFRTPVVAQVILSIVLPIAACILLRVLLSPALSLLKTIYTSAPHKRRVRAGHV